VGQLVCSPQPALGGLRYFRWHRRDAVSERCMTMGDTPEDIRRSLPPRPPSHFDPELLTWMEKPQGDIRYVRPWWQKVWDRITGNEPARDPFEWPA
jgi:hypothetical protein